MDAPDSLRLVPPPPPPFPGWYMSTYRWGVNGRTYSCVYVPLDHSRAHERRCCRCKASCHPASVWVVTLINCPIKHVHYDCYSCKAWVLTCGHSNEENEKAIFWKPTYPDVALNAALPRADEKGPHPAVMPFPVRCKGCKVLFSPDKYREHACWGWETDIFCFACETDHHPGVKIHREFEDMLPQTRYKYIQRVWCPFVAGHNIAWNRWITGNPDLPCSMPPSK